MASRTVLADGPQSLASKDPACVRAIATESPFPASIERRLAMTAAAARFFAATILVAIVEAGEFD